MAVSSLATYAPVVVIGDAEHQTELSGLVAAGAADYVVRTGGCLTVALGLVERRLRKAQSECPRGSCSRRKCLKRGKQTCSRKWIVRISVKCCGMN